MVDFHDLVDLCRGRRVYIQTHNFPDPDAIGSAFGLQKLLEHYDIQSEICYDGKIDKLSTSKMLEALDITMYSRQEIEPRLTEEDYIICVDSQKSGGNITDFVGNEVAAIDHHPTYVKVPYLFSDIRRVGACASIIADYYLQQGIHPERAVATALLYAIKSDTLQFSRGVTLQDIAAFSYLFPLVDKGIMMSLEMNNLEFRDLKAYGAAIENIRVYGYTGFSRIPFTCPDAMIAILSDFILSLIEVEVAVVYCQREDGLKFSVRSEREDVDAGVLVAEALKGLGNGGGHAAMAGGLIPRENQPLLGNFPDGTIQDRFLECVRAQSPEAK